MAEYIEREAINRICFMDYFLVDGEVRTESVALVRDIEKLPAADVAPVVRCRNCEHSYDDPGGLICSYGVCVDCVVPPGFLLLLWRYGRYVTSNCANSFLAVEKRGIFEQA